MEKEIFDECPERDLQLEGSALQMQAPVSRV